MHTLEQYSSVHLSEIQNHKNSLVAEWAKRSLDEIGNTIKMQERTESYERIKYQ